jgi:ferritin-like metal-binding protein YciE
MDAREEVVDWLRDAYAMERGLEITLKKISQSEKQPGACRTAATIHLEETRQHAATVASLLRSLGSDTSTIRTGVGLATELVKGLGTAMAGDEQIKDLLASYAMEHFEIGCYRALETAAEAAGLPDVAMACAEIVSDEENMAQIVSDALPDAVLQFLGAPAMSNAS